MQNVYHSRTQLDQLHVTEYAVQPLYGCSTLWQDSKVVYRNSRHLSNQFMRFFWLPQAALLWAPWGPNPQRLHACVWCPWQSLQTV